MLFLTKNSLRLFSNHTIYNDKRKIHVLWKKCDKTKKNSSNPSNIKRVTSKYHMNVTNLVKIRNFHNLPIFMDLCTEI